MVRLVSDLTPAPSPTREGGWIWFPPSAILPGKGAVKNLSGRQPRAGSGSINLGDGYMGIRKLPGGKDSFGSFLVTEKNNKRKRLL